ncbi:MAG: 2,3-bisphosphoglycerate-dependent phosphoglycerate mutase [Geminicoccaceae bacterium]
MTHPALPTLILVRHGTTTWSDENRFTGWGNAPLSPAGQELARKAGQMIEDSNLTFDIAYTSELKRAQETLGLMIEELDQPDLQVVKDWRLNERHYGVLQERYRSEIAEEFGASETIAWRRSYRARPPALQHDDPRWLEQGERLPMVPQSAMPETESMADCVDRVEACWHDSLAPLLKAGNRVLIVAHTCSIRGIIRILDGLDDKEAESFTLPTALPVVYEFDKDLKPRNTARLYGGVHGWWRQMRNKYKPRWLYWS